MEELRRVSQLNVCVARSFPLVNRQAIRSRKTGFPLHRRVPRREILAKLTESQLDLTAGVKCEGRLLDKAAPGGYCPHLCQRNCAKDVPSVIFEKIAHSGPISEADLSCPRALMQVEIGAVVG